MKDSVWVVMVSILGTSENTISSFSPSRHSWHLFFILVTLNLPLLSFPTPLPHSRSPIAVVFLVLVTPSYICKWCGQEFKHAGNISLLSLQKSWDTIQVSNLQLLPSFFQKIWSISRQSMHVFKDWELACSYTLSHFLSSDVRIFRV